MRSTPENLRIFPNPVQGFAEVHLKDRGEQFISYELLNSEGILLKSRKVHYSDQSAPVHIHLEDFHPGIYILIVRTDRSTYAKKVLKL